MGGFLSGRSGWREKVEAQHSVDIRWMKRKGWLNEGNRGTISWSSRGEETGSINYTVSNSKLNLTYRRRENGGEWVPVDVQISLEHTACNYGGKRVWMRCPCCSRRCAKVYLTGQSPACRKCYNLAYYSEGETQLDRILRQTRKAQDKLGYIDGGLSAYLPKPKGMHWKTYKRLQQKIDHGYSELRAEAMRRFNMEI